MMSLSEYNIPSGLIFELTGREYDSRGCEKVGYHHPSVVDITELWGNVLSSLPLGDEG